MHSIKPNFTRLYKDAVGRSGAMRLWQRRYWDHVIRDADDLANHKDVAQVVGHATSVRLVREQRGVTLVA